MPLLRSRRLRLATASISVAFLGLTLAASPGANAASIGTAVTTSPVLAAAGWLTTQFEDPGSRLPSPTGNQFSGSGYPNQGLNADAIFGLAAAKQGATKLSTALAYLVASIKDYADTAKQFGGPFDGSLGKAALAAQVAGVAGTTATDFGGMNLIQVLKADECTTATTVGDCDAIGAAHGVYASEAESFVILAEARAGGTASPSAAALTYFHSLQCTSGGFTESNVQGCGTSATESVDATAYAIMALQALGSGQTAQITKAVTWLAGQQDTATGSWNKLNTNSTGLAAAALAGQGVDVTKAQSWLLSQQVAAGNPGAGALKFPDSPGSAPTYDPSTAGNASPSVLATAQALPGLVAGGSLATLSAAGASPDTSMFAPVATTTAAAAVQGGSDTVTANGFVAGEVVQVDLHSSPVTVGTAIANTSGTVSLSFTVPGSTTAGAHTVVLTGATSGLTASSALTVTAAAQPAPSATPTTSSTPASTPDALADTGSNGRALADLAILASLLLASGLCMLGTARRRSA